MSIQFSDVSGNTGIAQQARKLARVDETQWPTVDIANSANNWFDKVAGYAIGADKRFAWDDTNHTKLPIGTTNLVAGQEMYSFLTDEQGNSIVTLTRIDILDDDGTWRRLKPIDVDLVEWGGIDQIEPEDGKPYAYQKVSDNVVRLFPASKVNVTAGLKFYFQRTPSYFSASDTTKTPGISPLLHRGFVVACAYDIALTLGLTNVNGLAGEMAKEEAKMIQYFKDRNKDTPGILQPLITPFM